MKFDDLTGLTSQVCHASGGLLALLLRIDLFHSIFVACQRTAPKAFGVPRDSFWFWFDKG
jgi:hypothetical protein